MKLTLIPAAIATTVVFVAGPALAQDAAQDTAMHFDGLYVSGIVGATAQNNDGGEGVVFDNGRNGSFGDVVRTAAGADAFSPGFCNGVALGNNPGAGCRKDRNNIEYGGRIGYDMRMGENFVVGGLFEVSRNKSRDGVSAFSTTPASYSFDRQLDNALSLRARAGYTPGGGILFYATGGASYAKIDHDFATTNTANSFTEVRDEKRVWGWQAGGGGEVMLTDNISLGLEYLYNRYRDNKYAVAVGQGTAPATNPFVLAGGVNMRPSDTRYDFHSLRATVSFQF
ncbi:outer membrane beta-barrel protein [Novosphingobium sp. PS1R-30]|uniref:Outer membrane beta-barrel protein n=1 Tax=Novosphingobium anseongense TaxID=3133436 RepID=A0ABU8S2M6_9SPHN